MMANLDPPGLRALGRTVMDECAQGQALSARSAAQLLFGPVGLAAARHGIDAMQRACADLVRSEPVWKTKFGVLPRGADGIVSEPVLFIASMARGILPLAGADRLRAAMAFWASERDPAVWRSMVPND